MYNKTSSNAESSITNSLDQNSPALTLLIAKNVITPDEFILLFEFIKHSKQDEKSMEKLMQWINMSTTTIIEHAMTTSFMQEARNEAITADISKQLNHNMTIKIEKYLKQEFNILNKELHLTTTESQDSY